MRKMIIALCATVAFGQIAYAQTGFKTVGNIDVTAKKIGIVITYTDNQYDNGGKGLVVRYESIDTAGQPFQKATIDSWTDPSGAVGHLVAEGQISNGEQHVSGANEIRATNEAIIVTRFLPNDKDPQTAVKTVYIFKKNVAVREVLYADGRKEKEQVLP